MGALHSSTEEISGYKELKCDTLNRYLNSKAAAGVKGKWGAINVQIECDISLLLLCRRDGRNTLTLYRLMSEIGSSWGGKSS